MICSITHRWLYGTSVPLWDAFGAGNRHNLSYIYFQKCSCGKHVIIGLVEFVSLEFYLNRLMEKLVLPFRLRTLNDFYPPTANSVTGVLLSKQTSQRI